MLPSAYRMRRSTDFTAVVRAGLRARAGRVVVHHAAAADDVAAAPPLIGFVVSKAVGNSVQRHSVTRRLRAQVSGRIDRLPPGSATVVRALPAAATAGSQSLGRDLDRAFAQLGYRAGAPDPVHQRRPGEQRSTSGSR